MTRIIIFSGRKLVTWKYAFPLHDDINSLQKIKMSSNHEESLKTLATSWEKMLSLMFLGKILSFHFYAVSSIYEYLLCDSTKHQNLWTVPFSFSFVVLKWGIELTKLKLKSENNKFDCIIMKLNPFCKWYKTQY